MRTVFVNPSRPRARRRTNKSASAALALRKPAAPVRRRRRRNAGIAPFVASSPKLIWPNPKGTPAVRRRRKRANPTALGRLTVKNVLSTTLSSAGGAGLAVGLDVLATSKIKNVWGRNGARLGAALASAAFVPGQFGAAGAGAMLFPVMKEIADYFLKDEEDAPTEADLDLLTQDLGAMIDPNDLKAW